MNLNLNSTNCPTPAASRFITKRSKFLDRTIFFRRGPQKGTLEGTRIYSIVMGPSVSQVAVASPFCRALKVFLVEE
jgi:hypothetical protein